MKIRLTEGQYKRLLTEDKKGRFNTITPQVFRLMELIYKHHKLSSKKEIISFLEKDMGIIGNESLTIYHSWITDFVDTPTNGWGELLGKELEFMGVYELKTNFPSYLCGRTYLPGFITVEASSEEDAINKMKDGTYIDMEIDENSQEYRNPDIDYDSEDIDIMEDMVIDHLYDEEEEWFEGKIQLK